VFLHFDLLQDPYSTRRSYWRKISQLFVVEHKKRSSCSCHRLGGDRVDNGFSVAWTVARDWVHAQVGGRSFDGYPAPSQPQRAWEKARKISLSTLPIPPNPPIPSEALASLLELVRQQGTVGGYDDDDRALRAASSLRRLLGPTSSSRPTGTPAMKFLRRPWFAWTNTPMV
jgi:hypothetical protein